MSNFSKMWGSLVGFIVQLLDLLVEATYLFLWALINWGLFRGLSSFHPTRVVIFVLWAAEVNFAAFTLAIIVLNLVGDFKASEEERKLIDVWKKIKDMASQLYSLIWLSTLLIFWAVINCLFDWGINHVVSQASFIVEVSAWVGEVAVALITLRKAVMGTYKQARLVYRRLFLAK